MSTTRFFGAHVSSAGGITNALSAAQQLEINTIQIHPSAPQRWNSKPFEKTVAEPFLNHPYRDAVQHVFFHAIYLINLANPDPQKQHLAKISLLHYLELSSWIGGSGVIVHVGSMKDEPDEAAGYDRVVAAIDWIMERSPSSSRLILEVAAGAGQVIGDRLEELADIRDLVAAKDRVGFGLDTQHMWASGYDWREQCEEVIEEIGRVMGFDAVWSVHLNDSKTELASRKDRHENIGDGLIGGDALKKVFLDSRLSSIPFILETPDLESLEGAAREVAKLRGFLQR